jgi:hypothetical protein
VFCGNVECYLAGFLGLVVALLLLQSVFISWGLDSLGLPLRFGSEVMVLLKDSIKLSCLSGLSIVYLTHIIQEQNKSFTSKSLFTIIFISFIDAEP